jgi:hypothetical protein
MFLACGVEASGISSKLSRPPPTPEGGPSDVVSPPFSVPSPPPASVDPNASCGHPRPRPRVAPQGAQPQLRRRLRPADTPAVTAWRARRKTEPARGTRRNQTSVKAGPDGPTANGCSARDGSTVPRPRPQRDHPASAARSRVHVGVHHVVVRDRVRMHALLEGDVASQEHVVELALPVGGRAAGGGR